MDVKGLSVAISYSAALFTWCFWLYQHEMSTYSSPQPSASVVKVVEMIDLVISIM